MDEELEQQEERPEAPADPAFYVIQSTLRALARQDALWVECTCEDCLFELALDLYERLSPYQRVLTV